MSSLGDGLREALELVVTADPALVRTVVSTLEISGLATLIAVAGGVPLGCWLALGSRRRHRAGRTAIAAGLRLPPVAVGQLLWLLMWPDSRWGGGPLAGLGWIYTTPAVVLAQTVLALPLVAALVAGGIDAVPRDLLAQARALGAGRRAVAGLALREARVAVVGAMLAGFGTAVAVVGAILVVGGNAGELTLASAALSSWSAAGLNPRAVADGVLLLGLFTAVAAVATTLQFRRAPLVGRGA